MLDEDYKFKTTFWNDFTIADTFGVSAIKDTFKRAFEEWKYNYIYLTELVLVLNWKIWEHWDKNNDKLASVYNKLWLKAQDYGYDNLKDEQLKYFIQTLD